MPETRKEQFEIGMEISSKGTKDTSRLYDVHDELIGVLSNLLFAEIHETANFIIRFISISGRPAKVTTTPLTVVGKGHHSKKDDNEKLLMEELDKAYDLCRIIADWLLGQEREKALQIIQEKHEEAKERLRNESNPGN